MKLDITDGPTRAWWEWPDYHGNSITTRSWKFLFAEEDMTIFNNGADHSAYIPAPEKSHFINIYDPVRAWRKRHHGYKNRPPTSVNGECYIEHTDFTRRMEYFINKKKNENVPRLIRKALDWYNALLINYLLAAN